MCGAGTCSRTDTQLRFPQRSRTAASALRRPPYAAPGAGIALLPEQDQAHLGADPDIAALPNLLEPTMVGLRLPHMDAAVPVVENGPGRHDSRPVAGDTTPEAARAPRLHARLLQSGEM